MILFEIRWNLDMPIWYAIDVAHWSGVTQRASFCFWDEQELKMWVKKKLGANVQLTTVTMRHSECFPKVYSTSTMPLCFQKSWQSPKSLLASPYWLADKPFEFSCASATVLAAFEVYRENSNATPYPTRKDEWVHPETRNRNERTKAHVPQMTKSTVCVVHLVPFISTDSVNRFAFSHLRNTPN